MTLLETLWANAQWYEVPMFVLGLMGLWWSPQNLRDAWGDWRFLRSNRINGVREKTQRFIIAVFVLCLLLSLAFIVIGFNAMRVPEVTMTTQRVTNYLALYTLPLGVVSIAWFYREMRKGAQGEYGKKSGGGA